MTPNKPYSRSRRVRHTLILVLVGFALILLGLEPDYFNLDRSPVVGFVQLAVYLVGLAFLCLGGFVGFAVPRGATRTIAADIGLRLVATGYVIAFVSGMADVFGFGSETFPEIPSFGVLQVTGVIIGEAVIAIGFLLVAIPGPAQEQEADKSSSLTSPPRQ